jgi:hypothetical protein
MAHLDIASKANPAVILPVLLVVRYLEDNGLLAGVTKSLLERDALSNSGKEVVRLQPEDGKSLFDRDVLLYLTSLSGGTSDKHTQAVRTCLKNQSINANRFRFTSGWAKVEI